MSKTTRPKRALLSGYYGYDNFGDELILATLIEHLRQANIEPVVLSANPEATMNHFQVEAFQRFSPGDIVQAIKSCDVFISGGGGLFQDSSSFRPPLYYGGLIHFAAVAQKAIAVFGQGIGPLNTKLGRYICKKSLQLADVIVLRDTASIDWAQNATGKTENITLMPDMVWARDCKKSTQALLGNRRGLCVSLREHATLNDTHLEQLAHDIMHWQQQFPGEPITLLACQENEDSETLCTLQTKLLAAGLQQITFVKGLDSITEAIASSRACIAMRFHALIMALKQETPVFTLAYDPKVRQLAEELKLPHWDLTTNKAPSELVAVSFQSIPKSKIAHYQDGARQALVNLTAWIHSLASFVLR